jgi:hypothetical protein
MPPERFEGEDTAAAARHALGMIAAGGQVRPIDVLRFFDQAGQDLFAKAVMQDIHCEDNRRAMRQCIARVMGARRSRRIVELCRRYEDPGLTDAERAALDREFAQMSGQALRPGACAPSVS